MMSYGRTLCLTIGFLLSCTGIASAQNFGSTIYGDTTTVGLHGKPYWQHNGGVPTATSVVPNSATDFVMIASSNSAIPGYVGYGGMIPLSNFASSQDLATATQKLNAGIANLNAGIASMAKKSAELSAVGAAFTIVPPNPGDRFSLSLSGAGWDGYGAGSISGAYRLNSQTLLFGGYATSLSQHMAKGGAAFSFH